MDQDAIEYIKNLESEIGEKIGWRSFSTWFGSSNGILREYGVFLCLLKEEIYLEDFERLPQILGYQLKSKNREKYVKYALRLPVDEIKSIKRVKKSEAKTAVTAMANAPISEASSFARFAFPIVTQIEMNDGTCYYFELISHKEFMAALEKLKENNL